METEMEVDNGGKLRWRGATVETRAFEEVVPCCSEGGVRATDHRRSAANGSKHQPTMADGVVRYAR